MKSVHIRSFSGLYFPAFGLNMEIFSVKSCNHAKCGKIRARKTPNTDTFYAVTTFLLESGKLSKFLVSDFLFVKGIISKR